MTDIAVTPQIIQALATYLKRDPSTITESHHLRDDLGLDSVAIIELLFDFEDRFKIQIPDEDLPGLSTVGSVASYVQQRLSSGKSSPKDKPKAAIVPKKQTPPSKKAAVPKKPSAAKKKAVAPKKTAAPKKAAAPKKPTTTKKKR